MQIKKTCLQVAVALGLMMGAGAALAEQQFTAFLTGYSYWDNTPRGSTAIARPVVHRGAGGTGTYADPVTLAVGHIKRGSRSIMDFPAGTRFYFPRLRKYAIVEDLCGDGNTPQNGPCHSGYKGYVWLDIYVDGRRAGNGAANQCMRRLTGIQRVLINPKRGHPVETGALTETGCRVYR
ncbi:MAG: hypothetical protein ACJAVM_002935 [Sulfitobacter sp.]|jgi:hypothetical protein